MAGTLAPPTATESPDTEAVQPFRWTRRLFAQLYDAGILGEDDHVELIEGELVAMAAQKSSHPVAVGLADDTLRASFGAGFHTRVQAPLALGERSEPEPDVAVIAGERRDYRDDHPGTAALVIEVADTSLRYDRARKGSLYARAAIPEFWIVNLQERLLEVYRDPRPDRTALYGASYSQRLILDPDQSIAPLGAPDRPVTVASLLP